MEALVRKSEIEEEYINKNSGESGSGSKTSSGGGAGMSDSALRQIQEFQRLREMEAYE